MKGSEVKIGETYLVKVSGNLSRVKITDEVIDYAGKKHWHGVNLATGRKIYIRGAGRLRLVGIPQSIQRQVRTCAECDKKFLTRNDGLDDGLCSACIVEIKAAIQ
jgi:hypothetical protein